MPGGIGRQLGSGCDPKLAEDMDEVGLHRGPRDEEPFGDLGVGQALSEELDDGDLGRGEAGPATGRAAPLAPPDYSGLRTWIRCVVRGASPFMHQRRASS